MRLSLCWASLVKQGFEPLSAAPRAHHSRMVSSVKCFMLASSDSATNDAIQLFKHLLAREAGVSIEPSV